MESNENPPLRTGNDERLFCDDQPRDVRISMRVPRSVLDTPTGFLTADHFGRLSPDSPQRRKIFWTE